MKLINGDLFSHQLEPLPATPAPGKRLVAENARQARERKPRLPDSEVDARVEADIVGAHLAGRTRNELAERLGISIQTLCWSLDRLLRAKKIFRRAWTPADFYQVVWADTSSFGKRPKFDSRDRCYLVFGALYQEYFESVAAARRTA